MRRISTLGIKKALQGLTYRAFVYKSGDVLLSHGKPTLSSALTGFTSEFEMGSGGSQSLLSPENWSRIRSIYSPERVALRSHAFLYQLLVLLTKEPFKIKEPSAVLKNNSC